LRVVFYEIDARLDIAKKAIDATETLTYRNLTGRPLDTFPFHLYLNAFQPTSTFMREARLYGAQARISGLEWDPKHYGAIEVKSLEAVGQGDLTKEMRLSSQTTPPPSTIPTTTRFFRFTSGNRWHRVPR
jgi:hypothetical protein